MIGEQSAGYKPDTDFASKLKVLKDTAVTSFKKELSFKNEQSAESTPTEMNYDRFLELLKNANLPELVNREAFNIFDTGNTGKSLLLLL